MPLGAFVALAGAYPSSTFPLLLAAAAAFLITAPRDIASPTTRAVDIPLLLFLAGIVVQLVPLPAAMVATLSPHAARLRTVISLAASAPMQTLSVDAALTRDGLASAVSAVLVFWSAREVFARGGVRLTARTLALFGAAAALAGMAQRVTSPHLLLWTWMPIDPGAQPYGPFVNRNHFATWLLMVTAVTLGYVTSHVRSHRLLQHQSVRLIIRDVLADGTVLLLAGCAAATTLALVASGSRGALAGAGVAVLAAGLLARQRRASGARFPIAMMAIVALLAWGVISNIGVLAARLARTTEVSRVTIWRETMPIVRDFTLTGTGLGTYAETMLVYQQTTSELLFNQAHDEYLQLAAEGGLLLCIPALIAVLAWCRQAGRRLRQDRRELLWVRLGAAAGVTGVAVHCIWEATLRLPANAFLLAVLAAIVVHHRRESPADQR